MIRKDLSLSLSRKGAQKYRTRHFRQRVAKVKIQEKSQI